MLLCSALLLGGLFTTGQAAQSGRGPTTASSEAFSGRLTVRYQRVAADGRPGSSPVPAIVLKLERWPVRGRWKTALTLQSSDPVWIESLTGRRPLQNPFGISRLEYDDDGTTPRVYGRRGELVKGPTNADRRLLGIPDTLRDPNAELATRLAAIVGGPGAPVGRGPAEGLLVHASDHPNRRLALERRFGRPIGTVRGLERFVVQAADRTQELLLDPDTALPAELNVARQGRLFSRTSFDYQASSTGSLLRRRLHTEFALGSSASGRLVSDIELTDVTIGQGTGR
jgi:hypothetical protein